MDIITQQSPAAPPSTIVSIYTDYRSSRSWASPPLAGTRRLRSDSSSAHIPHGCSYDGGGAACRGRGGRSANASARDNNNARRSGGARARSCSTDVGNTGRTRNRTDESKSCPSLSAFERWGGSEECEGRSYEDVRGAGGEVRCITKGGWVDGTIANKASPNCRKIWRVLR